MKVLKLIDKIDKTGGAEVQFFREKRIIDKSHNVRVLGFGKDKNGKSTTVIKPPRNWYTRRIQKIIPNPIIYWKVRKVTKDFEPDIIHLHNNKTYTPSVLLACRDRKVIKTVHDYSIVCPTGWSVYKDSMKVCSGGIGQKCVAHKCLGYKSYISYYQPLFQLRKYLGEVIDKYIAPSKKLTKYLNYHGYDAVNIPYPAFEDDGWKVKKDKNNNDTFVILYVGKLSKRKGVDILLKAFAKLEKQVKNVRLSIVGDGGRKEQLVKKSASMGVTEDVEFKGFVEHSKVSKCYKNADVLVVPSLWMDNFPLVISEAMKNRCPVIGSNRGGIPEMLSNGRGAVYKAEQPEDLVGKMLKLYNNKHLVESMTKRSIKYLQEERNPRIFMDRINQVYGNVRDN